MSNQMIFQRYEMKYLLTQKQKNSILKVMEPYMKLDKYGRVTIRNIYFDTDTYQLIRHSLERPAYKEKLRLRSYQRLEAKDPVFVELKKKYQSVVYKRRLVLPWEQAMECLCCSKQLPLQSQIAAEINYFCAYYHKLSPTVFLSYEREAFYSLDGSDFRVTFDENILSRQMDLSLESEIYGTPLIDQEMSLMEIKTSGGIPLWMVRCLSENKIFKTSFSKYGTAYKKIIQYNYKGGLLYV